MLAQGSLLGSQTSRDFVGVDGEAGCAGAWRATRRGADSLDPCCRSARSAFPPLKRLEGEAVESRHVGGRGEVAARREEDEMHDVSTPLEAVDRAVAW